MFVNSYFQKTFLVLCSLAIGFFISISFYYSNPDQLKATDSYSRKVSEKNYEELEIKFKAIESKLKELENKYGERVSNKYSQRIENSEEKLKELSLILKDKLQQLGQLSCKIVKDETSVNGGWCAKISGVGGGQHMTDLKLVSFLSSFLKGIVYSTCYKCQVILASELFWGCNKIKKLIIKKLTKID